MNESVDGFYVDCDGRDRLGYVIAVPDPATLARLHRIEAALDLLLMHCKHPMPSMPIIEEARRQHMKLLGSWSPHEDAEAVGVREAAD